MGFMPAFKYRQKNSLIVFERGHKAHGYVQTADGFLLGNRPLRPGLHSVAAPRLNTETEQRRCLRSLIL